MSKVIKTRPQVIMKNGVPDAVIVDIADYRNLLQRLQDKEDIDDLEKIRRGSLRFRGFDDLIDEHNNAITNCALNDMQRGI